MNDKIIREATKEDIKDLSLHHQLMFKEILEHQGEMLSAEISTELEKSYKQKLTVELLDGTCKSWVVTENNKIIASGAITLVSLVPSPYDLSSKVAYLHSMYTERHFRSQGCSQQILKEIIAYCKLKKINRVVLNSSEAGKPVYKKFAFQSSNDFMRLFIK